MDDDLLEQYRKEAAVAMEKESLKRIAETVDVGYESKLKSTSLHEVEDMIGALLSRLGAVRAALDGHGGGIDIESQDISENGFDFVLDLTGACLSCGAAPGTLEGIKSDLEKDDEINSIKYSSKLLDTFDELGREFILAHGNVEFV